MASISPVGPAPAITMSASPALAGGGPGLLKAPENVAEPGRERRWELHGSEVAAGELGEVGAYLARDRGARTVEGIVTQVGAARERDRVHPGRESDRYLAGRDQLQVR